MSELVVPERWTLTSEGMSCDGVHALDIQVGLDPEAEGVVVVRTAGGELRVEPADDGESFVPHVLRALQADGADVGDYDVLPTILLELEWMLPAPPTLGEVMRGSTRVNLADVKPRPVRWWWKPRIALGKVHLLGGDPGVGKSFVAQMLAALNSRHGGLAPDDSPGTDGPGRTLLLQVEDDLEDTVVPRLAKMGADLSQIEAFRLEDAFVLDADGIALLRRHLDDVRPSLVVVDPVTFFIGGKVDMHRANEVRQPLAALGALAQEFDCAVVLVIHLNKGEAKALYRVLGSIDFTAAVRSILLAGRVDGEPERGRALFHIKCNVGKEAPPMGYDVVEDGDDDVGLFVWRPDTDLTLAEVEGRRQGRPPDRFEEAKTWLRDLLRDGPRDAREVHRLASEAGFAEGTLKRAARATVYKEQPEGKGGAWVWSLPPLPRFPDDPSDPPSAIEALL